MNDEPPVSSFCLHPDRDPTSGTMLPRPDQLSVRPAQAAKPAHLGFLGLALAKFGLGEPWPLPLAWPMYMN